MPESNGNCQYREDYEFGNAVILECCKNPGAFRKITNHYKTRAKQELFFPYDMLILEMTERRYKFPNGKGERIPVIAIPLTNPGKYCNGCGFYQK
jgi:hypothetical protein